MEAKEMARTISACYRIPENKVGVGNIEVRSVENIDEWIAARKAVDVAIFKAGMEYGVKVGVDEALDTGKQLGRVEVVEWIESHDESTCMDCTCAYDFKIWDWQAKLKEWGIGNGH